jgi:hypothetical protein
MFGPLAYTCDRSIQVYERSRKFIEESIYAERIADLTWAYHSIGDVIPQTVDNLWSGHFFPWVECWEEIQISVNLCLFGLYKQAMVSLRSALELGLLSVYWNLNDDGHQVIQDWISSKEDTPRHDKIWKRLEQHKNFRIFQQQFDIKTRLLNLRFLHNYVHTKGYKYSNSMGLPTSNFQTFEERAFIIWFEAFDEVIKVLSILQLIKYPIGIIRYDFSAKFGIDTPSFGGLHEFEVERLEKILGEDVIRHLETVAKADDQVRSIMDWVTSLPGMSAEDFKNQIIEFDKKEIERIGLEKWLENEKILFGDRFAADPPHRGKVEYLTQWARENGYEKSIWERRVD